MKAANAHQSFTDLEVWKKARELKVEISRLVKSFPNEERYRLGDQMTRCARSITANIAEGHGRFTYKDQLQFCIIARGSLSELWNHLIDAYDEHYISREILSAFKVRYNTVSSLLNGYISHLRRNLHE